MKARKLLVSVMALYIVGAFVYAGRGYLPSGLPSWWGDGKTHIVKFVKANGDYRIIKFLGPDEALAQQPPGGPAAGSGTIPRAVNPVTGETTVTAGSITVTVPAAGYSPAIYSKCFASVHSPVPAVAGDLPACVVTSTATVIASATSTVGAVNIQTAGTPSPSPVIDWMLAP